MRWSDEIAYVFFDVPVWPFFITMASSLLLSFLIKTPLVVGIWFLLASAITIISAISALIILTRNDKATFFYLAYGIILVAIGCKIFEKYFALF